MCLLSDCAFMREVLMREVLWPWVEAVGHCWEHQMVESPQMEHHCVCVAGTSIGE